MKTKMLIAMIIIVLAAIPAAAVFAQDSFTFEVTEGFSFAEESDIAAIDISVPRVSGMADENDEILLNAHFLAKKDEIIADYKQNTEMAAANYPDGNGPHFEYKYSWEIVTDDEDHFVIWTTYFFAAGSAGEQNEVFNLDKKTGKLLFAEEVCAAGCVGSSLLSAVGSAGICLDHAKLLNLGDGIVSHGTVPELRHDTGIASAGIAAAAAELCAVNLEKL